MLEEWHLWVVAGLALWIVEIFTLGFVVAVFGAACLIAAPFAAAGATFKTQLLVFAGATALLALGIRPLILKCFHGREAKNRTNVDALIGMSGVVTEAIDNALGTGSARLGGEVWRAVTSDDSRIENGQKIVVRAVNGCKVVVEQTTTKQTG